MKDLIISCIQTSLVWEDKAANLQMFEELFEQLSSDSHVVVLPEMFSTGFSMNPEKLAESLDGPTVKWLKQQSNALRKIITGSIIIEDNGQYFNRLVWMQPDGVFHFYDKKHLFGFAGEDEKYASGNKKVIVQVNGWKINLQVCYDLRFPVWARQAPSNNDADNELYDVLLYVANWPERRIEAWDALLKARAIENQAFVVAVNRVGNDVNNIYHNGSSSIIDPWGKVLWNAQNETTVFTTTLSKGPLIDAREKLPFLKDRDKFIVY